MFDKILLAVDGSEHSKKAIPAAIDLAKMSGGEIRIVHVHQKELGTRESDDIETYAEAMLLSDAVLNLVMKAGVKAHAEMRPARFFDVAKEILDAAELHGADTIVLGSRGLGSFSELLLGSVAHKVIQLAHCPVLVVR